LTGPSATTHRTVPCPVCRKCLSNHIIIHRHTPYGVLPFVRMGSQMRPWQGLCNFDDRGSMPSPSRAALLERALRNASNNRQIDVGLDPRAVFPQRAHPSSALPFNALFPGKASETKRQQVWQSPSMIGFTIQVWTAKSIDMGHGHGRRDSHAPRRHQSRNGQQHGPWRSPGGREWPRSNAGCGLGRLERVGRGSPLFWI
jgi:hypothetical protein